MSFFSGVDDKVVEVFRSTIVDELNGSYSVRITPQISSLSVSISTLSIVVY